MTRNAMKIFLAGVAVLGLNISVTACGKGVGSEGTERPAQATVAADGKEFTLEQGESVRLEHSTLEFLSVPEDSRCPPDVQCIWAGNARLSLRLDDTPFELNTTVEPREADVAGFHFQLVQLTRRPPGDSVAEKYRATLKVTR